MSETRFGSWSAAASPVTIEYSLVVIEEIRHEVIEGVQRLSRGGVEVGGILYGTREGRTIRILSMRPITCEHARGPAFLLSDSDQQILEEQIEHGLEDPRLTDMICLGWFGSHTRSEVVLSDTDLELYEKYFSAPWQVTLIIRPGRGGSMRAGFFVREHDGTVHRDASYLEFNFPDRLAGVLDRPPRGDRPPATRGHTVYFRESGVAPARTESSAPVPPVPPLAPAAAPRLLPVPPPRPKWPWLVAWGVAVLVAVVFGLRYFVLAPQLDPLALSVVERGGQLQIGWNHNAKAVTSAVRGSLTVTDGQTPRTFPLTPQDLARGTFSYQRNSDDVAVRMNVEDARGDQDEDVYTFLAAAPEKADTGEKAAAVEKERDDLRAQVERLKRQNESQATQIQQLERDLKVLQSRLGIQ